MTRPSYKRALEWLALNDDCYWLRSSEPMLSVATALVADLFSKDDETTRKDLIKALWRVYPTHPVLRGPREFARIGGEL